MVQRIPAAPVRRKPTWGSHEMRKWSAWCFVLLLCAVPALAQQTGSIFGSVKMDDGTVLPGVLVEATSTGLPQARTTSTNDNGEYRLPLLPPGPYEVTFSMSGMATVKKSTTVFLQQTSTVNANLAPGTLEESINVVAEAATMDPTSAEIKSAIDEKAMKAIPLGQEYRDLVKLIPGVQYTEDVTRGPSAGGSGQDNAYQFDGVNVTLPLFGTLSAEPASHDIDQISVVKGGAKAIDFNRAGGFSINSISKSGTNRFKGEIGYQAQSDSMVGDRETSAAITAVKQDRNRDWLTGNIGGPILRDALYFYASAYRPTTQLDNRTNVYGAVPDSESVRDEYFGKVTWAPISSVLLNGSYRTSERDGSGIGVGGLAAGTISTGDDATQDIAIAEGSWVISSNSFASFKYTDYANETASRPDNLFSFGIATDGSVRLNVGALDSQGLFSVPTPLPSTVSGAAAFNEFIAPLVQRYGYLSNNVRTGGGLVGGASTINNQDFFREGFQVSYDRALGQRHNLHFGYQWSRDEEDLLRTSNGWGSITVPGGRVTFNNTPVFYQASFEQMTLGEGLVPGIHSEFESQSVEINDSIRLGVWTFNAGLLASNDILYGQGLRKNNANLSGFSPAPGHKYEMYEVGFDEMLQPRLGAVWAYNGNDTVYANYARYHPAASSLPRAASWDRSLARTIRAYFRADGSLIGTDPVAGSSGKFFDDDLDPRAVDEYMIGTSRQLSPGWTARVDARYRYGYNYWEDTNNDARVRFNPPAGIPRELYIPNLAAVQREIGGSSYVIAELDGAFTKYYEVAMETSWRGKNTFARGSYVWSHYYGNFDQDNTTGDNDQAIFIGSSNIADDPGRQLWDRKYGNLRGDRRHQLKAYGAYYLSWNASVGAYVIYQSGQPWETLDVEAYRDLLRSLNNTSTSNTNRFGEPAGSRTSDDHYQIDLNYTQDVRFAERFTAQFKADIFNLFDNQTGYDIQGACPGFVSGGLCPASYGQPRKFIEPRRFQLAVKLLF